MASRETSLAGSRQRILLVTDDPATSDLLRGTFEPKGFDIVETGSRASDPLLAAGNVPDLVILDWQAGGRSMPEACARLRQTIGAADAGIIILTPHGADSCRIRALESGADDSMTKPVSLLELFLRAQALLRRTGPAPGRPILSHRDVEMNVATRTVRRAGTRIPLGPTEFRLLHLLLRHPCHVFTRERLRLAVWGGRSDVDLRTVDTSVWRLRKALNAEGARELVRTVRTGGYALDSEA